MVMDAARLRLEACVVQGNLGPGEPHIAPPSTLSYH